MLKFRLAWLSFVITSAIAFIGVAVLFSVTAVQAESACANQSSSVNAGSQYPVVTEYRAGADGASMVLDNPTDNSMTVTVNGSFNNNTDGTYVSIDPQNVTIPAHSSVGISMDVNPGFTWDASDMGVYAGANADPYSVAPYAGGSSSC